MSGPEPQINVSNKQRKLAVDTESLREFIRKLVKKFKLQAGISVVLVNDASIRKLYRDYAGKDKATDVLSFRYGEEFGGEPYLGDIIVSVERARAQASDTLAKELEALTLHGLLHLMGYDHEADNGEMDAYESKLRKELGLQ